MFFKKFSKFQNSQLYDLIICIFFVILSFFIWKLKFYFPFWDEWSFIFDYSNNSYKFFVPHVEHFKPLFKMLYFLFLKIFKADFLKVHFIVLFVHGFVSFLIYKITANIIGNKKFALIAGMLFLINDLHSDGIYWNFQISSMLNVLLFLSSLFFLQLYIKNNKIGYFYVSSFLTFFQAYFYGTGLILPLINILYFFLFKTKKIFNKEIVIYSSILILNALIYLYFAHDRISSSTGGIHIGDFYLIMKYFLNAIFVNLFNNLFLFRFSIINIFIFYIILFFSVFYLYKLKAKNLKEIILFCLIFYISPFVLISLTRFRIDINQSFEGRYVYYYFVPICIYISYLFYNIFNCKKLVILKMLLTIYMMCFIVISLKNIYLIKGIKEVKYAYHYLNVISYIVNPNFPPDFRMLHPTLLKEEIKFAYNKLINDDLKNDPNIYYLNDLKMSKEEIMNKMTKIYYDN